MARKSSQRGRKEEQKADEVSIAESDTVVTTDGEESDEEEEEVEEETEEEVEEETEKKLKKKLKKN